MKVLVVVDMQNDFIMGSLGSENAENIVPHVLRKIKTFEGKVIFTRDTHKPNYLESQEGKNLPIPHCIIETFGWEIDSRLKPFQKELTIDKPSFGSIELGELLREVDKTQKIEEITLVGLCTDICVISNALLLKAFLPETSIIVDASCCAGVTKDSHSTALDAMKMCQIKIINA